MLALRLAALVLFLLSPALAQKTLVVYPFSSQEMLLGTAVAERAANVLADDAEVLGPAVAPVLVPLLATAEGFFSPLAFLNEPFNVASADGARLLQGAFGADAAASGEITIGDERLELRLYVATAAGVDAYRLQAASPGALAARTAVILADALELEPLAEAALRPHTAIDLAAAYGDYVRATLLLGAGLVEDAARALERALEGEDAEEAWQRMLDDIRAVQAGRDSENPALAAALALSLSAVSEARADGYLEQLALPFAGVWQALLRSSGGDPEGAREAFDLAASYPFGQGARALFLSEVEPQAAREDILALGETDSPAAALAAALAAQDLGDHELEKALLRHLGRLAPTLAYPFERLSFIAFDEDDALAAAQALTVATRLVPESDLYWTNLGWAHYLLGFLERSEEASRQAIELADGQEVAWYNLGLVEAVTGRLADALDSYEAALRRDVGVNAEAVEDLEAALELFPDEPGIHFALANLYEEAGRRQEAILEFERYLERGADQVFLEEAGRRLERLTAPPPEFTVAQVHLSLQPGAPAETDFRPGDRLHPDFELITEGFELPHEVIVRLELVDAEGAIVAEQREERAVPRGAIALRIRNLGLDLPEELAPGDYRLLLTVTADEGREAAEALALTVRGEVSLARQLLSRGVDLRALDGAPLLSMQALEREDADAGLLRALEGELRENAETAEEVLPEVAGGRFRGLRGGELFLESTRADLQDFLRFVLSQEGFLGTSITFVDAYAQWALDGAPAP